MKNKGELLNSIPDKLPEYDDLNLSPYPHIESELSANGEDNPFHFAYNLTTQLKEKNNVEMATHTFSHYYCLESGQDIEAFRKDIEAAVETAKDQEVTIESIVFPRNQFSEAHIAVCSEFGIKSYRGNQKHWIYRPVAGKDQHLIRRMFRLIDTYVNITGHHCFDLREISKSTPNNIPASRFLKPYIPSLRFLEGLKLQRIKDSMTHAAKHGKVFHLWWHPHNFGQNTDENINFLRKILTHYEKLSGDYDFQSITMGDLSKKLNTTL